jgi:hypothetical protein
MKKILFLSLLLFLLTACSGQETPQITLTLDEVDLNKTAVSRVTSDTIQTQSVISTATLEPVYTATPIPTLAQTRPSYKSPTPEQACNMAAAGHPIDVTIPDGTVMAPGETFSKTWRLENVGQCTWTPAYIITYFSGNSMDAIHNHSLPTEVEPGEMIDITVDMKAPASTGFYQGNWMLLDPQGELFGIGPNGDAPFWVQIEVALSITNTLQPTPTVTNTPMVYLTGDAVLIDQDQFDLDNGVRNPEDVTLVDFLYQLGGDPVHTFSTMNGTEWLLMDEDQPDFEDCVSSGLTGTPISFEAIPLGSYLCFKTSDGSPGWLLFEKFESGRLSISFLTWSTSSE